LQGGTAGVAYGTLHMAYYPDKMAFSQKGTVMAGPARGLAYITKTTIRPAVAFSAVTVTYATVECLAEELRGSHHKDPWNSFLAGAAAGMVLGGFLARRFDVASLTALGTGLLMGMVDFNGPSVTCDPTTEQAKHFPCSVSTKFEESEELKGLKSKYPAFKNN
jgi:Tim17/Tim22/Tim23/Pmp24 family